MLSAFQMMPARSFRQLFLAISLTGLFWPLPAGSRQDPQKPTEQKPEQREDVISLDTSQVILNVTVTDARERYVAGLTAKNFKLFEDRTPQKILNFTASEMPFAAAIVVDTSGSMEAKMSLARAACTRFVDGIREGDVFAIYTFGGTKVVKLQDFTEVRDVPDSLWDTRADGMTPLYDAVVTAVEALSKREERRRAILLVSDGDDTKSRVSFEEALRRASDVGVAIYAVDLSDAALSRGAMRSSGAEVLKSFALKTGGRFFKTPGGSLLRDAFTQTVEELRNQYTIAYEPSNEKRDGKWRTIELHLDRPSLIVRTRQGYYAAKGR
jgi:Ca-activated chloride channel family protein